MEKRWCRSILHEILLATTHWNAIMNWAVKIESDFSILNVVRHTSSRQLKAMANSSIFSLLFHFNKYFEEINFTRSTFWQHFHYDEWIFEQLKANRMLNIDNLSLLRKMMWILRKKILIKCNQNIFDKKVSVICGYKINCLLQV